MEESQASIKTSSFKSCKSGLSKKNTETVADNGQRFFKGGGLFSRLSKELQQPTRVLQEDDGEVVYDGEVIIDVNETVVINIKCN